jgi:hypothetical protein
MLRNMILGIAASMVLAAGSTSALAQGTAITYQGQLKISGAPANTATDFQFSLWTAASGGTQVGSTITSLAVPVANGLFTVPMDFGVNPYTSNQSLFLQMAVRNPAGTGAYVAMGSRQLLTPAPFALATRGLNVAADGSAAIGLPAAVSRLSLAPLGGVQLQSWHNAAGARKWNLNLNSFGTGTPGLFFSENGVNPSNLVLREGGNVGIGTSAPESKLSFGTFIPSPAVPTIALYEAGADKYGIGVESGALNFWAGGTVRARAKTDGSFQTENLLIAGLNGVSRGDIGIAANPNDWSSGSQVGDMIVRNVTAGGKALHLQSGSGVPALTIGGNNRVGIGTTTPFNALDVAPGSVIGASTMEGGLPDTVLNVGTKVSVGYNPNFAPRNRYAGMDVRVSQDLLGGDTPVIRSVIDFKGWINDISGSPSRTIMSIGGEGNVYVRPRTGTGFEMQVDGEIICVDLVETSSADLKRDIVPLSGGLESIMQLNPVSYAWNEKASEPVRGKHAIGFIAEEVNEVLPDIVTKDANGKTVGINYGKIAPVAVLAIQQLKVENDRMKADNAELKARLEKIEAMLAAQAAN